MKYFIDSNIFLRILIGDEKNQLTECISFLTLVKENKIDAYTSSLVLAEIVWTLTSYYQFPKEKVVRVVRSILNLRGIKIIDNYDHLWATDKYKKTSAKFIDCLIASISEVKSRNMTVVSYDKDFDKLPILRKEPKQIKG